MWPTIDFFQFYILPKDECLSNSSLIQFSWTYILDHSLLGSSNAGINKPGVSL